jgi:metal-responsive CopG/Arc/MetJ family transcriptional regulator
MIQNTSVKIPGLRAIATLFMKEIQMNSSKLNFKEGDHVVAKPNKEYKITNETTKCVVVETHSFMECMDVVVLEGKHKDYRATVPMCDFENLSEIEKKVSEEDED